MIHPIPPGTRDILPDEMRELRTLQATLIEVFERFGYGQVATPTLESARTASSTSAGSCSRSAPT